MFQLHECFNCKGQWQDYQTYIHHICDPVTGELVGQAVSNQDLAFKIDQLIQENRSNHIQIMILLTKLLQDKTP
jgi:hypothetical protein